MYFWVFSSISNPQRTRRALRFNSHSFFHKIGRFPKSFIAIYKTTDLIQLHNVGIVFAINNNISFVALFS
jgi:hypothetical protein